MKNYLNAKHWQLFLLFFGVPFLIYIVAVATMVSQISTGQNQEPDIEFLLTIFRILPVFALVYSILYYGWHYSVGMGLQSKLPPELKMNTGRFKIFFFFPMVYLSILCIALSIAFVPFIESIDSANPEKDLMIIPIAMAFMIPVHLFVVFCVFYTMYFAAKTIKTIELQRETKFADFAGEFFMIWFLPIGIWILQPMINKMYKGLPLREEGEYSN